MHLQMVATLTQIEPIFIDILKSEVKGTSVKSLASVIGRYYAMDRDKTLGTRERILRIYYNEPEHIRKDAVKVYKKIMPKISLTNLFRQL
jgi:bisphosphoglycerate-independent phosphoglycerate mutase (AlkP superfamily)